MRLSHIARHLRPKKLSDVVGQSVAVNLLKQALTKGLMLPVCSIFGPSGVGKTTLARLIAMWECCTDRQIDEPCGICQNCTMILNDTHPDVFELDGGTYTGVDNIKSMLESSTYSSASVNVNNKKVYILDEVHMLSRHAITALLKRFEEPMENLQFILATTNVEKLPDTLLSRSFQLRLDPISMPMLSDYMKQVCGMLECKVDEESLSYIAYAANGSMRQALSFLEQISLITDLNITPDKTRNMLGLASYDVIGKFISIFESGDVKSMFAALDELKSVEPGIFMKQLLSTIQNRIREGKASLRLVQVGYDLAEASVIMHRSPWSNNILEICIGHAIINNSNEDASLQPKDEAKQSGARLSDLAKEIF